MLSYIALDQHGREVVGVVDDETRTAPTLRRASTNSATNASRSTTATATHSSSARSYATIRLSPID